MNKDTTTTKWGTDRIVATGLVVMGIFAVLGNIAYNWTYGATGATEIPMAIVSGLTGFLGRGILNEVQAKRQMPVPPCPEVQIPVTQEKKEIPTMAKDKIKDLSRDAK